MVNSINSLEKIIESEGILISSDLHGNYNLISQGLRYSQENNLTYIVNGDIVNDYKFKELSKEIGYKSSHDIQLEYFSKNLSQKDLEALILAQNVSRYGIDEILAQMPKEHHTQLKLQLSQILEYTNSDLFQKKIQSVSEEMIKEKGNEIQENTMKLRALYSVFMDAEAKRFAEELNKYSTVKVLFNKGNHENTFFVENVRAYLVNKDQIIDLTDSDVVSIKNSTKSKLTLGGMTNCAQLMPYLHEIFAPEELQNLYSHTFQEKDFGGRSLDVFLTHGQIGKPVGIKDAFDVPYLESAKTASLTAKLTIEGHIHNKYDGRNEFNSQMIRAAGEEVAIIKKVGDKLEKTWIKLNGDYAGGHNNQVLHNANYYKQKVEELLKEYEFMMTNQKRA